MTIDALIETSRPRFEAYFLTSRRSRGVGRKPCLQRLPDGTYATDHTQRHWWTWQQAIRETHTQGSQS